MINYSRESIKDRTKDLTGGAGADVIYDAVGGVAFDQAIRCINWKGRLLIIGFASGRIPALPVNLVLRKGCEIVGVFWGSFTVREADVNRQNLAELGALLREGKIKPHISATYALERTADALNALLERKTTGKVVLTTGRS